jgi:hypothetical protein
MTETLFDKHPQQAAEEEGYYFDGTHVWDADDVLFHVGRVRDGAEMHAMIYAFRQGRTAGEKLGRAKLQGEIAALLCVQSS